MKSPSVSWPIKVELELKLNHTEISRIRWITGVRLNDRKKSEVLREHAIGTGQFHDQKE